MNRYQWNILVVDDLEAESTKEFIEGKKVFRDNESYTGHFLQVVTCKSFDDAINHLKLYRIHLVILDLKDDSTDKEGDKYAGEKIFDTIKELLFVPIIFYTGYSYKVSKSSGPFVKVVERGESERLREEIVNIFETKLPEFLNYVREEERGYLWDFVQEHKENLGDLGKDPDIPILLARRLSSVLELKMIRKFLNDIRNTPFESSVQSTYFPMEMYLYPPQHGGLLGGDILKEDDNYYVILTPSCDLDQNKAEFILLAKAQKVEETEEYKKCKDDISSGKEISNAKMKGLQKLIGNNRKAPGHSPERYYFLPQTFFIPNLVVDYQNLYSRSSNDDLIGKRIASLDTPFAEECLNRFSQYFGRIGTPDLDKVGLAKKLISSIEE